MAEPITPTTFHLDVTGANGTPFRFVLRPIGSDGDATVRHYDRRYTLKEGEFGYHLTNFNEHGQSCGPATMSDDYSPDSDFGLAGWHDVRAWDIDVHTRRLVGTWIANVLGLGEGS
jgi:hypothetical protein